MKRIVFSLLITGLTVAALVAQENKITEEAVLRVIRALDETKARKDAPALFQYLANDFTFTSKRRDGSVRASMKLPEYQEYLIKLFTKPAETKTTHGKITIEISSDGKSAIAKYETFHHAETPQRGAIRWSVMEVNTFTLKDDKILLKSVELVPDKPLGDRQSDIDF